MLGDMSKNVETVMEYNTDKFNLDFKKLTEKIEKDKLNRLNQSEFVKFKVKGTFEEKTKEINYVDQNIKKAKIEKMMDKNTCYDLFREVKINNKPLYDQRNYNMEKMVKFKMELSNLHDTYIKLR
jgi:hypothetical protein